MRPRITSFLKGLRAPSYFNRTTKVVLGTVTLSAALIIAGYAYDATQAFSGGSGTIEDPYIITTCTELQDIGSSDDNLKASYLIANDIDCSGIPNFDPIGDMNLAWYQSAKIFYGRLNGGGHTISNLTINQPTDSFVGMFAQMNGAVVKNLKIVNANVTGRGVGALVGSAYLSSIVGISISSSTITTDAGGGALAGGIGNNGVVSQISVTNTLVQNTDPTDYGYARSVGGIVGYIGGSVLSNSFSSATTTNASWPAGGIAGGAGNATIINVYSTGRTTATKSVGGIVGFFDNFYGATVKSSYFNGFATTTDGLTGKIGGIVGDCSNGFYLPHIYDSFAVGVVGSTTESGGISGCTVNDIQNTYYYPTGTGQTRCDYADYGGYSPGQCTADNTSADYNSNTFAPESSWDFVHMWQNVASNRPSLRLLPYTAPTSATSIGTCAALVSAVLTNPDGWYALSGDIDCAGDPTLIPISYYRPDATFTGTLDGNNYTINGITISTTTNTDNIGLFGTVAGAYIKNLVLAGGGITALFSENIGALAGEAFASSFYRIFSSVDVDGGRNNVGGIIGADAQYIGSSHVTGNISGSYNGSASDGSYVGGLIGSSYTFQHLIIEDSSYTNGTITAGSTGGGIAGFLNRADIRNSSSTVNLVIGDNGGGIVGGMGDRYSSSTITNASFNGTIKGNIPFENYTSSVGGIAGGVTNVTFDNVTSSAILNLSDSTGFDTVGGIVGVVDDYSGFSSNIRNSSFTGSIYAATTTDGTGGFYSVGGIVGSGGFYGEVTNVTSSTTMVFGSIGVPTTGGAGGIGGLFGYGGATLVASSTAYGSISIYADTSSGSVGDVGGVVGNDGYSGQTYTNVIPLPTITISANEIYEVGGFTGYTRSDLDNVSASSTLSLTAGGSAYDIGGLVGYMRGNIANSHSSTTIALTSGTEAYEIGGLVGYTNSDITTSYSVGSVSVSAPSAYYIGGLIGDYEGSLINTSYSTSPVSVSAGQDGSSQAYQIGGFAGYTDSAPTIQDIYSSSTVSVSSAVTSGIGAYQIGGLFGTVDAGAIITNGYSSGAVTFTSLSATSDRIGGAFGEVTDVYGANTISNVFSASPITAGAGATNVGGFIGAYGVTDVFTNIAFDTFRTGQAFCTSVDNPDPSWCTARNLGNAAPNYFFSSANAPQSSWNFAGTWLARVADFPIFGISSGPPPATPPSVTTDGSSSITQTGALLAGTLTATGTAAVIEEGFVYGTTTTYSATSTSSGSGFSAGSYTKSLSSLTASTTYHFAAYAKSADGTAYGSDLTFTTSSGGGGPPPPTAPSVTTDGSSNISQTSALLAGTLTATGTAAVTEEGFVYGATSAYGATTTSSSGGFTAGAYTKSLSSLTASTTYHFAAYAKSVDGTGYGTDLSFTTSAATSSGTSTPPSGGGGGGSGGGSSSGHSSDVTAPIITNVKVDSSTNGTVTITWDTNEPASSLVQYGPTTALGYTTSETNTSPRVTSHTVTIPAADCKNVAHFSIFSTDASGNTGISPNHSFITTFCPSTAPPAVVPPPAPTPAPTPAPSSGIISHLPTFLGGNGGTNGESGSGGEGSQGSQDSVSPGGDVTVNKGAPVAADRIVNLFLTVPDGAVAFVITNETLGTPAVTVPVTSNTQQLDLCQGASTCRDQAYALSFYYLMLDGSKSPVITRTVNLQAAANDETGVIDTTGGLAGTFANLFDLKRLANIAAITGIVATIFSMLWNTFLPLRALADLPLVLWRNLVTLFSLGFLRRRKNNQWGTVYDSATRRGLDPAIVSVFDAAGKRLKTAITDLDGRYAFLLPAGIYSLKAEKSYHSFPARNIPAIDPVFPHPYTGGPITLNEAAVLTADVPLDPTEFDWNEAEKYKTGLYRFYSRLDRPRAYLSMLLTIVGGVCAVVSLFVNPNPLNMVLFAIYALILLYYVLSGLPRIYGGIYDRKGMHVPFALVRAKLRGAQTWGAHTVTDQFGRYYLLLPPGKLFDVSVETLTAPDTYTPLWQGTVAVDNGYLNKKFNV